MTLEKFTNQYQGTLQAWEPERRPLGKQEYFARQSRMYKECKFILQ